MRQADDRVDLNLEFDRALILDTDAMPWDASPAAGVERRRLERACRESGHATSLVRYAPGSRFSAHVHDGGEEFLVLDGVFSDEAGDYPAGSYIRNPPGSRHAPSSAPGCVIFVKLCQMPASEQARVVVLPDEREWQPSTAPGAEETVLFDAPYERVTLHRLHDGELLPWRATHGHLECLIVSGRVASGGVIHGPRTWLRFPVGTEGEWLSHGVAVLWCKQHLDGDDHVS